MHVPKSGTASVETRCRCVLLGGELEIDSVSGEIDVAVAAQEISLETVSGDVDAHAENVDLEVNCVRGDIRVEIAEGRLDLESVADFGENYHGFRSKITTHSERSDAGCLIIVKW